MQVWWDQLGDDEVLDAKNVAGVIWKGFPQKI